MTRWPGWSHLPRDARDVLFLLGVIGWTIAPHLVRLPLWCSLLAGLVLVWRARLALVNGALPHRAWPVAVLLAGIALTFQTYGTLFGKDAGVTLLVVLLTLKTLELRARRDALVVFFLGFFVVLTNFFYSQSLLVALAMLVSVWGLLTALVLAHMPVGRPAVATAGALAARAAAWGTPAMVALFLLFPRFGPLWGMPEDVLAKTGLSGSLRMGGIAEIALDDAIAFRVRFDGPPPPAEAMYWRGPVLSRFDGVEWKRHDASHFLTQETLELRAAGPGLPYEMTLEPSRLPLLPMLEATPDRGPDRPRVEGMRVRVRGDLQWVSDRPLTDRVRVRGRAWTRFEYGPRGGLATQHEDTALPVGHSPRTIAWAQALRQRLPDAGPAALANAVLAHIRAGYTYTLTPGTYGDEDPNAAIDEFWLDRRQGFCEHFSTAFVVVMRALGVPARIVTGYQGADPELQDGFVVVRQANAHAWAEIWLAGRGWVRVDPTAAVAPERIQRSQTLRAPAGAVAGAIATVNPELAARLRAAWESVNNRWNQWVLNYARSQQFDLLQRLGIQQPSWTDLAYALLALLSGTALVGAAWAFWDRHRRDPWQRQAARLRRLLARAGVQAAPHEGTRALAQRLRALHGERAHDAAQALLAIEPQRYGRGARVRPDRNSERRVALALRGLRAPAGA
jgi:transglutaminase-like putative cysteine protease